MLRKTVGWVLLGVLLSTVSLVAFADAVVFTWYSAGETTIGMFDNMVGVAVTGMHIEFDRDVTIVHKVEFGGYVTPLGPLTGTAFDFIGNLVAGATLELDWQPAEAMPVLVQWISGTTPIGAPYFTTVEVLGRLLGQGIVMLREQNPALLAVVFEQFFALNTEFFAGLEQTLGMSIQDTLLPVIMTAPAEGIENFFNTMIGMLGVTTLEGLMQGDVDLSPLLGLLGL